MAEPLFLRNLHRIVFFDEQIWGQWWGVGSEWWFEHNRPHLKHAA